MNTDQLHDSNRFELGNNANPQEIRYIAANFNKFLEAVTEFLSQVSLNRVFLTPASEVL